MNVSVCKVFVMGWECWTADVSECSGSQTVRCVIVCRAVFGWRGGFFWSCR